MDHYIIYQILSNSHELEITTLKGFYYESKNTF